MYGASFSIWKDKIVLQVPTAIPGEPFIIEAKERPKYWGELGDYCKYNEKFGAYLLTFSKQNLIRIYNQFGKIPVTKGQYQIDLLKENLSEFYFLKTQLTEIISGDYDKEDLGYKMPPLALYQHRGATFLTKNKRAPLFADCGLGKTYMVLVSTQYQIENGIIPRGKVLIAGKLATLFSGWLKDTEKFTDLKAEVLWTHSNYKRKEKIKKKLESDADIFIINHEGVRVYRKELAEIGFKKVVVDESTILKSFSGEHSKMSGGIFGKALMEVSREADWRVIMSGTPAPNSPKDLWGQMHFLDPEGFLLERSFFDFRTSFMEEVFFGKVDKVTGLPINPNTPSTWIIKPNVAKEISEIINPYCFRVRIRDHLKDLPERTIIKRPVYLSHEQANLYGKVRKEVFAIVNDDTVSISNKLTEIIKLRQITGGFIITDQQNAVEMEDNPKMNALDSLILDEISTEEKVVIFSQYQWEITSIQNRYKEFGAVSVYGGNTSKKNLQNIETFIRDKDCRVIVLHPRSAAHGITLTMAHYMIFYSVSYSAEEDYQCIKRIERAGQKHPMFIYYLLADIPEWEKEVEGVGMSIDEIIYKSVQKKISNQETLLDGEEFTRDYGEDIINNWRSYG